MDCEERGGSVGKRVDKGYKEDKGDGEDGETGRRGDGERA